MKNKDFFNSLNNINGDNMGKVDVNVMLSDDILNFIKGLEKFATDDEVSDKECPNCHKKWKDIADGLEVGCEVCYKVFKKEIEEVMKTRNLLPNLRVRDKLDELKRDLEVQIRLENYEKAEEIKKKIEEATHENSGI